MKKFPFLALFLATITFLISCTTQPGGRDPGSDEFTFVFMTDIHVMPLRQADKGFAQAIANVNGLAPDFVITGGDLIMDALSVSYDTALIQYTLYDSLVRDFQMPVHNTMGNHEIWGWYKSSRADTNHPEYGKKMFQKRIGPRYKVFEHKGWKFLILDSVIPNGEGGYMGGIDDEQVKWIKQVLAETDSLQPIVLSTHIPFLTVEAQIIKGSTTANSRGAVITNALEVLRLFEGYNLKLVLQGHLHYLEDIEVFGTHFITAGAVSGSWWSGPGMQTEEGFLLVKVNGDELDWEYVDYGWEAPAEAEPLR